MPAVLAPKNIAELVKLLAKHSKNALLVSGIDPTSDRVPAGKVVIDVTGVESLNGITTQKERICIGTGMNLGRLARDAVAENGLLRQSASIVANPLVRNK